MTSTESDSQMVPTRSEGLRTAVDGDQITITDHNGRVHRLNPTAYALWVLCDGETTAIEMADAVRSLFGIDGRTAMHDVAAALQRFDEEGLVQWRSGETGS